MTTGSRRWLPLGALGFAAALAGCGHGAPEVELQRWIAEPPRGELAAADLREVDCVERFEFPEGQVPEGLELVEGSVVRGVGSGLTVRGGWKAPRLRFSRPLDSAEVNGARVVVAGLRRGKVRLGWLDGGSRAQPDENPAMEDEAGSGPLRDHFLVDWSSEPGRTGMARLELEPTTQAGEVVTLGEICVGRVRVSAERIAEASRASWYVALDGETREALVLAAGQILARSVRVPGRGRLDLGIGVVSGQAVAATLVVSAQREGAEPLVLLERRLSPDQIADRWLDLSIDLAPAGAGAATLALEIRPELEAPDQVFAVAAPQVVSARRERRPNIVLISIDTLRADHLSLYGYERETSPHLNAWARRRGVVFERVVAPSGWTLPSHFSLFTGLEAFRHSANYYKGAFDTGDYRFLAEELRAAGYRTIAVTAGGFVHPDFGLGRGFERFRIWKAGVKADDELETHLREVHELLDGVGDDPLFLFFHTYEVHTPNPAREPFFSRFSRLPTDLMSELVQDPPDATAGFLGSLHAAARRRVPGAKPEALPPELAGLPVDAYDSAVAFTDDRLAPLLERLARPPFAERTFVAVFSDHGESLAPTGRAGHGYLSLDNLMVPLVVSLPGAHPPARAVASQVRLIDLFPTVLDVAGLPVPEGLDGITLTRLIGGSSEPGRTAFAYSASTNFGLARLSAQGVKLEWRNSPWRPLAGGLVWQEVDGFAERLLPDAPEGIPAGDWTRELHSAYARGIPGLRLEVSTDSRDAVQLELVSDLIDPVSTKTPDVEVEGLVWKDVGRLSATLGPDHPLRLHFERIPRREPGVQISASRTGCGESETLAISGGAEQLRAPRTWRIALARCADSPQAAVVVRAFWQGPVPSGELSAADESLAEDLRALGYLQ